MKKVLVTGGAGFIGSHVVDQCIAQGYQVIVVDNLATGRRENVHPEAIFVQMDIHAGTLKEVLAEHQPDYVAHLAAQMNVTLSLKDPMRDATDNVLGTVNVLQQSVETGVKKLVFSSSSGVIYGEPTKLPVSEEDPTNPVSHYGVSKLAGEHYIRLYHHIYGLPFAVLRFANVYGPRQQPHGEAGVCSILAMRMLEGRRPVLYGFGDPLRDYVFVQDVAKSVLLAMEAGDGATMNIASGRGTSVRELFTIIKELTGFEEDPILEPLRPGEVTGIFASCERAGEVLGWRAETDLREGLRQTVDFFRARAQG